MIKFIEFIDKKEREAKHQLKIIERILATNGFTVKDHLDDDDPFLFVFNPKKTTFFDGIRIYKIGDNLAFRVQKEEKTEPFGKAYDLPIEEMFTDLITDNRPEEAAKKIIKAVTTEVTKFFRKSSEAEKDLRDKEFERTGDPFGKVSVKSSDFGVDYSNLTYMKA
jgi:hypothetical protein